MGDVIYIRTRDGVLIRFDDKGTLKSWFEAGKISLTDRYLGPDKKWLSASELFKVEVVTDRMEESSEGADPDSTLGVEEFRDAVMEETESSPVETVPMRTTKEKEARPPENDDEEQDEEEKEEESLQSEGDDLPGRAMPESVDDPGPKNVATVDEQRIWAIDEGSEIESDEIWASDPDYERYAYRGGSKRKIGVAFAVIAGCLAIGFIAWHLMAGDWAKRDDAPASVETAVMVTSRAETGATAVERTRVSDEGNINAAPTSGDDVLAPVGADHEDRDALTARVDEALVADAGGVEDDEKEEPKKPVISTRREDRAPSREIVSISDQCDIHMAKGNRLIAVNPEKALPHFQFAATRCPNLAEPRSRIGKCEYRMGKLESATAQYEAALKIGPNYSPAIIGLARTHAKMGNDQDARYQYLRYLKVNPHGSLAMEAKQYLGR